MDQMFLTALESAQSILDYTDIHLVGIKGVAMTSLALCLQDAGVKITGSDVEEEFVTEEILKKRKFHIFHGFSPDNISENIQLVVYTGAHQGKNNPEVIRAAKLGIPVMSNAQALGELMKGKNVISVCGTGGKSTTSAMIAWILEKAGLSPSFAIGVGNIPNFGVSGRFVKDSRWFIAEADEYAVDPTNDKRPRFIFQDPEAIVCTNLTYDHPDIYKDFGAMKEVFTAFFKTAHSSLYANADSPDLFQIFNTLREKDQIDYFSCSVGFDAKSDYQMTNIETELGKTTFSFSYVGYAERQGFVHKSKVWNGELQIPGAHNVRNALLAAVTTVNECGLDFPKALYALSEFEGTMRRF